MKVDIPIKIISIENDGFHLMIPAKVNGHKINLLIDTGASRSAFDISRISELINMDNLQKNERLSAGLGTNTMESQIAIIDKLSFSKVVLKKYNAVLIDMSHVNEMYESIKLSPIDGVFGSDLLVKMKAVINYKKKTLRLTV
jgi:predicted aspartyl protease